MKKKDTKTVLTKKRLEYLKKHNKVKRLDDELLDLIIRSRMRK